jgi:hypothetical protein
MTQNIIKNNNKQIKNTTNSKGSSANEFTINEYCLNDYRDATNGFYRCLKGANRHEHK